MLGMVVSTCRKVIHSLAVLVYCLLLQIRYWHHRVSGALDVEWLEIHFNRIAVINLLLSRKPNGSYLEIGCEGNQAFNSILVADKTGVDPAAGGTHRMTSDAYFAQTDKKFDVIFVDGLHTYDQVRRDAIHALEHLNEGGWVVFHDLIPRNWQEEHMPRLSSYWTGDVWKVAFEINQTPGLEFALLYIDMGVGVMRRKPTGSVEIPDLSAQLTTERFAYFLKHYQELPVLQAAEGRQWLLDRI